MALILRLIQLLTAVRPIIDWLRERAKRKCECKAKDGEK